jgi:uncharacterized protein with PQ loop repeat
MNATLANLAVVAATVGTVTFLIPQILKLVRTGDSEGVSTTWPALGFVTNVGWFAYVIAQAFWAAILAPLITFVSYAVTIWALRRTGRELRASYIRGLTWAALLILTTVLFGWDILGVVLGLSYGVMVAPSVWSAFKSADPSGVSPGTWWIGAAEASLWGYFGLYNRAAGIITFGVVGITASILMLYRYYSTRRPVETPISEPVP